MMSRGEGGGMCVCVCARSWWCQELDGGGGGTLSLALTDTRLFWEAVLWGKIIKFTTVL